MVATMAQALVAGLVCVDADAQGDRAALDRLALWLLQRYTPVVACDPPDGLMIDITGAAHLRGGEVAMVQDIVDRLAAAGIEARAAGRVNLRRGACTGALQCRRRADPGRC